jgi:hypothetical protein
MAGVPQVCRLPAAGLNLGLGVDVPLSSQPKPLNFGIALATRVPHTACFRGGILVMQEQDFSQSPRKFPSLTSSPQHTAHASLTKISRDSQTR